MAHDGWVDGKGTGWLSSIDFSTPDDTLAIMPNRDPRPN